MPQDRKVDALTKGTVVLQKQILTAIAITIVAVLSIWFASTGSRMLALPTPVDGSAAARLAFAGRWLLVPGLTLFAGIVAVAARRFFSADAFDGTRAPESKNLEINLRYNQNTLEQVVLAAIAWTGLALVLPLHQLTLIPALAILFAIGRALFWLGYLATPWARALGFGFSFYPTAAALLYLLLVLVQSRTPVG